MMSQNNEGNSNPSRTTFELVKPGEEDGEPPKYTEFFSWGSDKYGQLGLAQDYESQREEEMKQVAYFVPNSLSFDIIIEQLSCGDHHAAFLTATDQVFTLGRNDVGQLGIGDQETKYSTSPVLVHAEAFALNHLPIQIKCGGSHCALVTNGGYLYTWGSGAHGATGLGQVVTTFEPTAPTFKGLQSEDVIVKSVSCGKHGTVVVTQQGQVFVAGDNRKRQLGVQGKHETVQEFTLLPGLYYKVEKAACGETHTLLLNDQNTVYAVGENSQGNLGQGHKFSSDIPLKVHGLKDVFVQDISAGRHSAIVTDDGRLFVWGPALDPTVPLLEPQELRADKKVMQVCIGQETSALINADGHVFTWGLSNEQGQLGIHETQPQPLPVVVGSLAQRIATQIEVGLDFCLALGQDCEKNPSIKTDFPQEEVQAEQEVKEEADATAKLSEETQQKALDADTEYAKVIKATEKEEPLAEQSVKPEVDHLKELQSKVQSLEAEKESLKEQLAKSEKENEFLIKNAAEEIQKITDFIELYQRKQKRKYEDLRLAFEAKEEVNKRLQTRVKELEDIIGIERKTAFETWELEQRKQNPPLSAPMAKASSLLRRHLQPQSREETSRSNSTKRVMFQLGEESSYAQPRKASRSRERAIFETMDQQKLFLDPVSEADARQPLETSTQSAAWPMDLYFENQVEPEPLRHQIENNNSAQERLARLLEIADSPIRKKVTFEALNPGKILKTPPKTKGEILQAELARENLATYGPMSRQVFSNLENQRNQAYSCPESIHTDPEQLYSGPRDSALSINKRDYNFIGNREKKEYVEGGIAIYESAKLLSPRDKDKTLLGQKTLSEVQHKLNVVKKNKESIEARLHFFENKLEQELPRLSLDQMQD